MQDNNNKKSFEKGARNLLFVILFSFVGLPGPATEQNTNYNVSCENHHVCLMVRELESVPHVAWFDNFSKNWRTRVVGLTADAMKRCLWTLRTKSLRILRKSAGSYAK